MSMLLKLSMLWKLSTVNINAVEIEHAVVIKYAMEIECVNYVISLLNCPWRVSSSPTASYRPYW